MKKTILTTAVIFLALISQAGNPEFMKATIYFLIFLLLKH